MAANEGCTIGFWRNDDNSEPDFANWIPTLYQPSDIYSTVFGAGPNITLLQALGSGGGGLNRLLRQSVAALLNASHPEVDYALTKTEVITRTRAAIQSGDQTLIGDLAEEFDGFNNAGCPLHRIRT